MFFDNLLLSIHVVTIKWTICILITIESIHYYIPQYVYWNILAGHHRLGGIPDYRLVPTYTLQVPFLL